jgi:hypothetical protein
VHLPLGSVLPISEIRGESIVAQVRASRHPDRENRRMLITKIAAS